MNRIERLVEQYRPLFEKDGRLSWAWPMFEGLETFLLTVGTRTSKGVHVRDPMDMKRLMMFVIYALTPAILFGMYNTGYTSYLYEGLADEATVWQCFARGAWHMLPIIIVSYAAGGIAELLFAIVRRHEINEGFLVSAMLYPLTLAPTTPLWMVAAGIIFGVIVGKEVFGGVGMNILNPALTARAFVFFTYPAVISGAGIWDAAGVANPLTTTGATVDGYTGATPLLVVANGERGQQPVELLQQYDWDWWTLFMGYNPDSMGASSELMILLGAIFLIATGVASWRIMAGCVVGLVAITGAFWGMSGTFTEGALPFYALPPHYHLVMGGFAFAAVFMATDPVSASHTKLGRWLFGIGVGALTGLIRVLNPAYPEGAMLAVLFMNVFAPLIDYYVVQASTRRRVARMATA